MLLAWVAAALGVLTKGLVAAAIPAAVLVIYSLYARDFTPWRRLHAAIGLALDKLHARKDVKILGEAFLDSFGYGAIYKEPPPF